jgi:hypothetical protein
MDSIEGSIVRLKTAMVLSRLTCVLLRCARKWSFCSDERCPLDAPSTRTTRAMPHPIRRSPGSG